MVFDHRPAALAAGLLLSAALACAPPEPPAVAQPVSDATELFERASDLYLAGDLAAARTAFRRAAWSLGTSTEAAEAWYWLGRCELVLGRPEEARRSLQRASEVAGQAVPGAAEIGARNALAARVLVARADVALMQSKPAESLAHLRSVDADGLRGTVDAGEYAYREAIALEALGRVDQARSAYLAAARLLRSVGLAEESRRRARGLSRPQYVATAGIYAARSSAEAVAWLLKGLGVPADVRLDDDGRLYAVALGRFDSLDEATRAAHRASAHGFPATVRPQRAPGERIAR
jgi:tetratricopeptide (TPR) repeat protein